MGEVAILSLLIIIIFTQLIIVQCHVVCVCSTIPRDCSSDSVYDRALHAKWGLALVQICVG